MRRLLRKKGFSLLELVIVIAIIGILTAMIVPTLSTGEAQKKAALSGAKDFYSATQYLVTKYSRFEGFLSDEMKQQQLGNDTNNLSSDSILEFKKAFCGNYPQSTNNYIMISMAVRRSEIAYVNAVSAPTVAECEEKIFKQEGLIKSGDNYVMTPFERVFAQDVDPLFEQQDGVYYATIRAEGHTATLLEETSINPSMRVIMAGFCSDELPIASGDINTYRNDVLLFREDFRLANNFYMGVCSSLKDSSNNYVGAPGSYFSANV